MMRTTRRAWLGSSSLIVAGLVGVAAVVSAGETRTSVLQTLQGSWKSGAAEGQGLATWTFQGSTLQVEMPGIGYVADVEVDDSVQPARLDCTITKGQAEVVGETIFGLVAVEGERAVIAVSIPGSPRPASLDPAEGVFRFDLTRKAAN